LKTRVTTASPKPKLQDAHADYAARIAQHQLSPLWSFFNDWFTPEPRVAAVPHLWRYEALRPVLLESADIISAAEAERRVLVLENPGLKGKHVVTESLYAGLQLITPGEVAPAHRHTPVALRFIVEGSGGYTAVEGEKAYMEPGDLIVTPSWTWHDHGHEGEGPVVWLDVLDVPLIRFLGAGFTDHYPEERFPERVPAGDSLYRYGANMRPADYRRDERASPVFCYPYARAREALERLKRRAEWDPYHGLKMEYIDPTTGGSAIPTISTFLQLLPKGFETATYRSTEGAVFSVVEGRGTVMAGGEGGRRSFAFGPRDIFAIPCWCPYSINADDEAVIFSASDRIVQTKLGIWREQR
jgi:gentisate 1,2-dioxygenase